MMTMLGVFPSVAVVAMVAVSAMVAMRAMVAMVVVMPGQFLARGVERFGVFGQPGLTASDRQCTQPQTLRNISEHCVELLGGCA